MLGLVCLTAPLRDTGKLVLLLFYKTAATESLDDTKRTVRVVTMRFFLFIFTFLSNSIAYADDFFNCVCYSHGGKIEEQGTPRELFGNPQRECTQHFLRAVKSAD